MPKATYAIATPEDDDQYSEHTEHLFCTDPYCYCKESSLLIEELTGYFNEGLVSVEDADRIYRGKNV